jgi:hypothetical protein
VSGIQRRRERGRYEGKMGRFGHGRGAACLPPRTDQELLATAHQAVDRTLDRQATFSMEESTVAQ